MNVESEINPIVSDNADTVYEIRVVNFDNSDVGNGIHNIDRITDLIEIQ